MRRHGRAAEKRLAMVEEAIWRAQKALRARRAQEEAKRAMLAARNASEPRYAPGDLQNTANDGYRAFMRGNYEVRVRPGF